MNNQYNNQYNNQFMPYNGYPNFNPYYQQPKIVRKRNSGERKKKLFLDFMMMFVSLVLLTTSSYAWFTENANVSIADMTVNVAASDGIQISLDASTWKARITSTDLMSSTLNDATPMYGGYNQIPYNGNPTSPLEVSPVSTGGAVSSGRLTMYRGTIGADANGIFKLSSVADTESARQGGNFFAFDVYILASKKVVVNLLGSSVTSASATGIEHAARVAFINEGYVAAGSAPATAYALWGGTTASIWEPNADDHTDAAISHAASTYGATITNGNRVASYYGINATFTAQAINTTSATYVSSVTPAMQTNGDAVAAGDYAYDAGGSITSGLALTLQSGINKVRIYAWFEGQDYDCQDLAAGNLATFNIIFAKDTRATTAANA